MPTGGGWLLPPGFTIVPRLSLLRVMAVKLTSCGVRQVNRYASTVPKKVQVEERVSRAVGLQLRAAANLRRGAARAVASERSCKWSYQIVFPPDGSRFTALLGFFSLEQKESIARRNYASTHAVMSSDREGARVFGTRDTQEGEKREITKLARRL